MTYYEILEIAENASLEVITMAYRALSVKYHPDKFKEDPKFAKEHWKRLNAAYLVLSDAEQKQQYDDFLRWKRSQQQETPSEITVENNEPKQPAEKPTKSIKGKGSPSFTRSAITVSVLLSLAFVLELLIYSVVKEYPFGYALFAAFADFVLFTFSYTLVPLLIGATKKTFTIKFVENMSWINSAIVMVVWNVITKSPGTGWMLMIFYTFINKHIVIQMHQKIQQRTHRILIAGITLLVLAMASVCCLLRFHAILY